MKVTDRKELLNRPVESPGAPRPDGGAPAPAAPSTGEDRVSVSQAARDLAQLREQVGPLDGVRTETVSHVQGLIASGQYAPDLHHVATNVLRDVLGELVA